MSRLNNALVEAVRPDAEALEELRWLVERHHELTASELAAQLLADWEKTADEVWHVVPIDRARRLEAQAAARVASSA